MDRLEYDRKIEELNLIFEQRERAAIAESVQRNRAKLRTFDTGATRDTDEGKLDYEGFFHPLVLKRFATYMNQHRIQTDGNFRASDNWQKGIPKEELMKSLLRHTMDVWLHHRDTEAATEDLKDALCGVMFNTMAYFLDTLKKDKYPLDKVKYKSYDV